MDEGKLDNPYETICRLDLIILCKHKHTLPIIILLMKGSQNQRQIADCFNLRSRESIRRSLETLEKLKLVKVKTKTGSTEKRYSLTEKGEEVSEALYKVCLLLHD